MLGIYELSKQNTSVINIISPLYPSRNKIISPKSNKLKSSFFSKYVFLNSISFWGLLSSIIALNFICNIISMKLIGIGKFSKLLENYSEISTQ